MTIETQGNSLRDIDASGATSIPVPFPVIRAEDLAVTGMSADGTETFYILDIDYTVALLRDVSGFPLSALVTFFNPLPDGTKLTIVRTVPITQERRFIHSQGYFPEDMERAVDRLTMIDQQQQEQIDRAIEGGGIPEDVIADIIAVKEAVNTISVAVTTEEQARKQADINLGQQITAAVTTEANDRQEQVDDLNDQIRATNNVLAGVHTTSLIGAFLTKAINGTTSVAKNLFPDGTVFMAGKTLINDTSGTLGVYIGDIDAATINVATKTTSPIGAEETPNLGRVQTNADLPPTVAAAETIWGRTPTLNNYATVEVDETMGGKRVEWYITAIDADGNITWGNPIVINTSDFQEQSTASDAGKVLTGGATAGTFGTSLEIDTAPTVGSNNLPNSDGVAQALAAKADILSPVFTGTPSGPPLSETSPAGQFVTKGDLDAAIKAAGGLPVGSIFPWPFSTPPPGSIKVDGTYNGNGLVSRTEFPSLFALAEPDMITDGEWLTLAATQSSIGQFSSGDGSTTFRLPKIVDYIRGMEAGGMIGEWLGDAIRNIRSSTGYQFEGKGDISVTNMAPFVISAKTSGSAFQIVSPAPQNDTRWLSFDASTTGIPTAAENRPKSIRYPYYIKAFDAATNQGLIDLTELANDVADKFDKTSAADLDKIAWYGMPSTRVIAIDAIVPSGAYTAPANGFVCVRAVALVSGAYIGIRNSSINSYSTAPDIGNISFVYVPVSKNDIVTFDFQTTASTVTANFIYANGATDGVIYPEPEIVTGNYSLGEQWTGRRWIDGRKIYWKTINFGALPNATTKSVAHNIANLSTICDCRGIGIIPTSPGSSLNIPNATSANDLIGIYTSNTVVAVTSSSNRTAYSAYITLMYTKTVET